MSKNNQKTVLTAPNLKRLGAYIIDFIILYLVYFVFFSFFGVTPEIPATAPIFLGAVGLALVYRIIVPFFVFKGDKKGMTIGKLAMGLKVIMANGKAVTLPSLTIRSVFYFLIEGYEVMALLYFLNAIAAFGFAEIVYLAYMNVTIAMASVVIMFIKPSHRMLHDYVANTVVILAKQ
ncbi:MAG: RDD family protein [Bacilli bacterium]|nr:RDD family protein [Bacilli bacterium]